MNYITKEAVYDLLADLEAVYPEATAAFRVAVAEMPAAFACDAWITRDDEKCGVKIYSHKTGG